MSRNKFVWEVQVRREVLDDEIARLHELPYIVWRDLGRKSLRRLVRGRDDRTYQLTVRAGFVGESDNIRVTLSLARKGRLRRGRIRQDFVITPDNEFRV